MRLLLDEHLDRDVAAQLRARGFDIVAVTEEAGDRGGSDAAVFERAVTERRAVVTYDAGDLRVVADERVLNEEHHFGVVLVSARRFPQGKRYMGALIEALAEPLEERPADDALLDRELWL